MISKLKSILIKYNVGIVDDKIKGIDSLKIVEILLAFEEEFSVHIPDEFAVELSNLTLEDIVCEIDKLRKEGDYHG